MNLIHTFQDQNRNIGGAWTAEIFKQEREGESGIP